MGNTSEVCWTGELIEKEVVAAVAKVTSLDQDEITRDRVFIGDLPMDSLEVIELLMDLEERFDLSIPDENADNIRTVGEAADHVAEQLLTPPPRTTPTT